MKIHRVAGASACLFCFASLLAGCERHFFRSEGVVASDGGALSAWSRPVEGCSPDPLDRLPAGQSSTLFTLYWTNTVDRERPVRRRPRTQNRLESLEVMRKSTGLDGVLKTALIDPPTELNSTVCSTFKATTGPGKPVIAGGRPTVDGSLDLDCKVAGSHLTASVQFTGCEF